MERSTSDDELARAHARIAELEAEVALGRAARALLEATPSFITRVGLDGTILFLNKYQPGFTPEQVIGKATIFDFTQPEHQARMRECLESVIANGEPDGFSSVGAGADGRLTRYFTQMAPLLQDGEVESVALLATDVSQVTEAMRALEESEAKLRLVLAATRMGTFTVDPTGQFMGVGDARTREIVGVTEERADSAFARVHKDDHEVLFAGAKETLEVPGPHGPYELRLVHADGSIRWVHTYATRVIGADGSAQIIGGVLDVTERRRLEEALAQTEKLDSLGRLVGGVAHDFNNMLTAILSYAVLARAGAAEGSQLAADIDQIRSAAERSASLTKQLLAFSRKQAFATEVVAANEVVSAVDKLLRRILGEDIELVTVLGATSNIAADKNQLEQVLVNLATNARHAMKAGGRFTLGTADVSLDVDQAKLLGMAAGPAVRVVVSDTGAGMSAGQLEHLFEPFYTTKGVGEGTGLGLATSYGIVRKHRGAIGVRSTVGEGTTFTIHLPAVVAAAPARATAKPLEKGLAGSETILVVEDEPLVRRLVCTTLLRHGYVVIEASDGQEALELSRGAPFDLVLTDAVMPRMNGPTLVNELRALRPTLRAIVMSGYMEPGEGAGGEPYGRLPKPFLPGELARAVRDALDAPVPRRDDDVR
jgi:PAS domain S-box-containing protein